VPEPRPDLRALGADVPWPDHEAGQRTRAALTAEPGLGRLAELAEWLAAVQGCAPPHQPARVRAVVLGAQPDEATEELATGLRVGVRFETAFRAASIAECVAAGAALADDEIDTGADLLIAAAPGPTGAAAVSVLTDTEPVKVLGRGTAATDPERWMARVVAVRDARRAAIAFRTDPAALLAALRQPTLAAATGLLLRAASRRTPVLVDGLVVSAAALIAYEAQPRAVRWWLAADSPADPAHELALTKLGLRPVLHLGMALADATAGLLAVPVLRAAVRPARMRRDG
jgi:nicotinate-nucleotide--dimethylbenzimidazole phosphoribosyltransferase